MHEANGDGAGLGPSILPALARQLPHLHGPNHRGGLVVVFFFFSPLPRNKGSSWGAQLVQKQRTNLSSFPLFCAHKYKS